LTPYSLARLSVILAASLLISACTTQRSSVPARTATEELLISTAADRAAAALSLSIPTGTTVYIDRQYFQGTDDGYALNAVRTPFLKK